MSETYVESYVEAREGGFYWYLIGEFNSHVIAQGMARTHKVAMKRCQEAHFSYLETVST